MGEEPINKTRNVKVSQGSFRVFGEVILTILLLITILSAGLLKGRYVDI